MEHTLGWQHNVALHSEMEEAKDCLGEDQVLGMQKGGAVEVRMLSRSSASGVMMAHRVKVPNNPDLSGLVVGWAPHTLAEEVVLCKHNLRIEP